jgi:acyl carrier protein
MRGERSGVSFTHDVSSNSSSENSDDGSIASGKLTPYTEVATTPNEITGLLMELVAETCGFRLSDIHQNMALESLGMDSLMTIEFQEGLQQKFGHAPEPRILSPAMTIRELALELAGDISSPAREDSAHFNENATSKTLLREPSEAQFVLHLQRGPDNYPPLILFHDGSGLIKKYERLPKLGCNLFGVRNPELNVRPHWARNLKDMASRYAASIASVVKAKQVVLGGRFPSLAVGRKCTDVRRLVFRGGARP